MRRSLTICGLLFAIVVALAACQSTPTTEKTHTIQQKETSREVIVE